jgi:lysophospholipase L1-like esterase
VRLRALAFRLAALALGLGMGLLLAGGLGEAWFRYLRRHDFQDCKWSPDPELGFVNHVGPCRIRTAEFDVRYEHNREGFHDDEVADPRRPVILALGDSHTWAVGVSKDEAWPNVLERLLADQSPSPAVINMGVPGYNLGQEYLLMRRYQRQLRPRAAVLAFSMATDAYDIRPPRYGGFVYGAQYPRTYFDLDGNGELILARGGTAPAADSALTRLKGFLLERSQLYGAIRRSAAAYYAVPLLRLLGVSAWPNMDGILATRLGPADENSWRLIDKLLRRFREELDAEGVLFTVVVLPYLPQVYDEVWDKAFAGGGEGFDRFAGNRRLSLICEAAGIDCLDLTPEFVARVRATGRYLHFRVDGHANAEGHELIGRRLFEHLRGRLEGSPASVRALGQGAGREHARGGRVAPAP